MDTVRRITGALVFLIGTALLLVIWIVGTPDNSCEHDTAFYLKGTQIDCEARNAEIAIPALTDTPLVGQIQ